MADYSTFRHGGTTYPLPATVNNTLLQDADPALFYTLDYFTSVIGTMLGARFQKEIARTPAMTGVTSPIVTVVPYDPTPWLQESQFRFPLLSVFRKKDKWTWKTIGVHEDAGEWEVDYILPPVTAGQMERMAPFLHSVGVILNDRIENVFDPSYRSGAHVWELAGISEIKLDEASYGGWQAAGGLYYPTWKGKLIVKEVDPFTGQYSNLQPLTFINSTVTVQSAGLGGITVAGLTLVESSKNFNSGFSMQVASLPIQVPTSTASPANVSETEVTGIFYPGTFRLQVSGTFTATYLVEGSVDGVNWNDITPTFVNASTGVAITTITAPGLYSLNVASPPFVRVRCSAFTSNTSVAMTVSGIV